MEDYLCITVRFLDGTFHGRSDQSLPEWPPSPLRLFQALVASSAARWNERERIQQALPMLQWLEVQTAPSIISPAFTLGKTYRLYVPDNVGDLVAKSWSRGGDATMADYRTEKDVRPIHLNGEEPVRYLWKLSLDDGIFPQIRDLLFQASDSITHLGWGIDHVVVQGSILTQAQVSGFPGQQWRPVDEEKGVSLRVPCYGTTEDLMRKHSDFLQRISPNGFKPVAPLSKYKVMTYLNSVQPKKIPFAAFSLLKPDATGLRPFDTPRKGMMVAGMMRHASSDKTMATSLAWPSEKINTLILGHGEAEGEAHQPVKGPRLAYLPLPNLEPRGGKALVVGNIRRVLVAGLKGCKNEDVKQMAQLLSGRSLKEESSGENVAMLSRLPDSDRMVQRYIKESETWATVTPVILPGYDDARKYRRRLFPVDPSTSSSLDAEEQKILLAKIDKRIDSLIRKAIQQAGFSAELARHALIAWRGSGYWQGTNLASQYVIPEKFRRYRRLHVKISWRDSQGNPIAISGPLCLGRGRYLGIGLFASQDITLANKLD